MKCSFLDNFWLNLKSTLKSLAIITSAVSVIIIYDSIKADDLEGVFLPLLFFTLFPVVTLLVAVYTYLLSLNLNRWGCSVIFGIISVISHFSWYLLVGFFTEGSKGLTFDFRMNVIAFLISSLLYVQLSWKDYA